MHPSSGKGRETLIQQVWGKIRRPQSTNQKVAQGKCPLHLDHLHEVVCSNTLFSNTSVLTNSLSFRASSIYIQSFSNTPFGRTLLRSDFGGLLLEHISQRGRGVTDRGSKSAQRFSEIARILPIRNGQESAEKFSDPLPLDPICTKFWLALCFLPKRDGAVGSNLVALLDLAWRSCRRT